MPIYAHGDDWHLRGIAGGFNPPGRAFGSVRPKDIDHLAQEEIAQRLAEILGIGPVTTTTVVATVGMPSFFAMVENSQPGLLSCPGSGRLGHQNGAYYLSVDGPGRILSNGGIAGRSPGISTGCKLNREEISTVPRFAR